MLGISSGAVCLHSEHTGLGIVLIRDIYISLPEVGIPRDDENK